MEIDDTDSSVTICRLCAEMTSSKSFIPLYTDDKQEQTVAKQINQLVSNLISPNDGLPQDVCLNCAENVGKFYEFVSNIIETQNKLRRIMQLPEIKKIGSSEDDQISFADPDNTSHNALTHADDGPEIIDSKAIRLNGKKKVSPNKETRTFRAQQPTVSYGPPLRLYRCSACSSRFKFKEDCLRHIVRQHSGTKKEVSGNTIFEKISSEGGSRGDSSQPNGGKVATSGVPGSKTIASTTKPSVTLSKCTTSIATATATTTTTTCSKLSAPLSTAKANTTATSRPASSTKEVKDQQPKTGTRRRKVLAIDGFFKEVQMQKEVARHICDVCGRSMASKFAFVRHLREHDWSDEDEDEKEKQRKEKSKRPSNIEREIVPKPTAEYCKFCKTLVANAVRHKMYHEIRKLEVTYPSVALLLDVA